MRNEIFQIPLCLFKQIILICYSNLFVYFNILMPIEAVIFKKPLLENIYWVLVWNHYPYVNVLEVYSNNIMG